MRPISSAALMFGITLILLILSGCAVSGTAGSPHGDGHANTAMEVDGVRLSESDGSIFHILAGELYGRDKQYDQAADHYAQVALDSDDVAVLERAIQAAIFAERFDLAQQLADRLREADPGNARAAAVMMIASLELGQTDEADLALNQWLEADSGNVEQIFNETGQYLQNSLARDRAIAYTHHLSERFPQQYHAQTVVAKLALSFKEMELAQRAAERAMSLRPDETAPYDLAMVIANHPGDIKHTLGVLEKAYARFPNEGRYISGLIEARIAAGQLEAAAALLERTLANKPSDPKLLRNLALFGYQLERPTLSQRALRQLEAMPGQMDVVQLIRGRVALQDGELVAAENAFSQVSTRSEHFANAQVLLAAARMELGRLEDAVNGLELARFAEGIDEADRQQLTLALASTLAESGRFDDSLEIADQAIETWPETNDFRLQKAMSLFALDRSQAALTVLREIIAREPDHAAALNALGYTLADENRQLEEAEDLIFRALHISPNNSAYLDSLGWLRYRQGKFTQAIQALETAFRQMPNAEVGAHLGEALWADGQHDRAMETWLHALEIDATDQTLIDTLDRLAPELLPANDHP